MSHSNSSTSLRHTLWLVLAVFCLTACDSGSNGTDAPYYYVRPEGDIETIPASGITTTIPIETNMVFSVSCDAPWLKVVKTNLVIIEITAEPNPSREERKAIVTLSGEDKKSYIELTQEGVRLSFQQGGSMDVAARGSKHSVNVACNIGYVVESNASWLIVERTDAAETFNLYVSPADSQSARTGTITISGNSCTDELTVTQAGYGPDPLGLCPGDNHPHAVDMGIGVMFACCNVGADTPADYGDYFAWGETVPKSTYTIQNYKWCNGNTWSYTKYNSWSSEGTVDNLTHLEAADDAAHVNWGGDWRMPEHTDMALLIDNGTWELTSIGGQNGYLVTADNSNRLFLPAAGYRDGARLSAVGSRGIYLNASLSGNGASWASILYLKLIEASHTIDGCSREVGMSVRPARGTAIPYLRPAASELEIGASAYTRGFSVVTNVDFTVSTDATWLTVTKTTASSVNISATANTSTSARTAIVTFSGNGVTAILTVVQAGVGS